MSHVSVDSWVPVAGAGIECKAMEHVALKLDALHYFELETVNVESLAGADSRPDVSPSNTVGFEALTTGRVGMNYHF